MIWPLIIAYVIFAVAGSTLIKAGSADGVTALFTVPLIHLRVSLMMLLGVISYGISFVLYTVLLSRFDLSFVSPVTVGCVYLLLMLTALLFFHEPVTATKIAGSILIFVGVIFMVLK